MKKSPENRFARLSREPCFTNVGAVCGAFGVTCRARCADPRHHWSECKNDYGANGMLNHIVDNHHRLQKVAPFMAGAGLVMLCAAPILGDAALVSRIVSTLLGVSGVLLTGLGCHIHANSTNRCKVLAQSANELGATSACRAKKP